MKKTWVMVVTASLFCVTFGCGAFASPRVECWPHLIRDSSQYVNDVLKGDLAWGRAGYQVGNPGSASVVWASKHDTDRTETKITDIGYATAGGPLWLLFEAGDTDSHVCQIWAGTTKPVENIMQMKTLDVQVFRSDENGNKIALIDTVTVPVVLQEYVDHRKLFLRTDFAIPEAWAGKYIVVQFDGTCEDEKCEAIGHKSSGDAPLDASLFEAFVRVVKLDLAIWNGGSDLDNGQAPHGGQGSQVADVDEETVGAYLLVNWDDDDADGVMNRDGTWVTLPVPDLTENAVANEDNLAQLKPVLAPDIDAGTVELEVGGRDAGRIKIWTQSIKGTPIPLTSNKKIWRFDNPTEKADFKEFMTGAYWIEGVDAGITERGITLLLRYRDNMGTEICNDVCAATVVMMNLGNAVYRDNMIDLWGIGQNSRGHAAIVWRYEGTCSKTALANDANFMLIEMAGPTDNRNLTTITRQQGYPSYGCFRNPAVTHVQRLQIIHAARALVGRGRITYTVTEAVRPANWNGRLDTITGLRCDGLVEVCYEVNGVEVWGMQRDPDNHAVHYDVSDQADNWNYNAVLGTWANRRNNRPDNLEEHNDFDSVGWEGTLMPATQCGNVAPVEAATQFRRQNLCQPIGSTGGN